MNTVKINTRKYLSGYYPKTYSGIIFLLTLLIISASALKGQGLEFEDEVYDTLPRLATLEGTKDADLPSSVDLSPYCPEVRDQGEIFSCVGWAAGYGAMTISKAIRHNWTNKRQITEEAYSAMFIYNQIKSGSCKQGARISDAVELLKNQGDCLSREFDFEVENCQQQPAEYLVRKAGKDTITDYLTLFNSGEDPNEKIRRVKMALAQKRPVIIGMAVLRNFYKLTNARYWWPELGDATPAGGHAMVVVGYDEPSSSFLLFNSWGKDWGDDGYIRLKYKYFGKYCKYAFILHATQIEKPQYDPSDPEIEVRPLMQMKGTASFKYLSEFSGPGAEPIFKVASVNGQKGRYTTNPPVWEVGQLFQLEASAREQGLYVYAFTIDPLHNIHIHWPRKGFLNIKFKGMNESALVLDPKARIVIPGPEKALKLANPGKDVLYVLFSRKKIRHLKFICEKMRFSSGAYRSRLEEVMGRHLVPLPDITYAPDEMSFSVSTRSEGYIVPLILEVAAR